ncbi:MAG: hypothetical protein LBD67_07795 [Candidatus Accumulibacter sp.]|nr:hypothetical protein [Accumulibacter sp.]
MNTLAPENSRLPARSFKKILQFLPALLIGFLPVAHARDSGTLGRLFFTPERRQSLDHQRNSGLQGKAVIPGGGLGLSVNGVVVRSSGKRTVWINGHPRDETDKEIAISASMKTPARITIRSGDMSVSSAKVGNTLFRDTGEVDDLLRDGAVTLKKTGD